MWVLFYKSKIMKLRIHFTDYTGFLINYKIHFPFAIDNLEIGQVVSSEA
jgi:hypothetical protein